MNQVSPISAQMLERLEQGCAARPELGVMSNAISRTALDDAAFVPAGAAKLRMDFSVVVPTNGITNQKQSGRCWMFSVMNLLRQRVIEKCGLEDFALSGTYLAFYDKLEKANLFFENIIHFAGQELDERETWMLLEKPLPDGGQWDMVVSLIRKYGIVPDWVMPETVHSTGTAKYMPILNRKLREDALELRALVKEGKDPAVRREEMLQEIYNALRVLYGQPPKTFDFVYTDKDKAYHSDKGLTPQRFFQKYIGDDFDDYAVIIASPIHELNRTYCQPFMGDIVEDNMFWLNLSQPELEELAIRQLKAGEHVMFSCDCHPDGDRKNGYWDQDTFQYGEVLGGMTFGMDKAQRLLTRDSTMNHCMLLCGVNLDENDRADRWKIENSWGDASGQKGYFVASEKWFQANVYQITARKSFLSDAQRALLGQQPLPMKLWDPLA
ncbi:MAG: aminopeptidase C [Faecalibacterium sp.]